MKSSGVVGGGGSDVALETYQGAATKRTVVFDGHSCDGGGSWFIKFARETTPPPSTLIKFTPEAASDKTFNIYININIGWAI